MASIRLENLTKRFGNFTAVDALELSIDHGEFVALLGPSGCGKTTTMNMIAGMETPTAGEIYFDERSMRDVPMGRRSVGFVFQNYAIFTRMTVHGNLSFGLRARKPRPSKQEIDQEVKRVAEIVGLSTVLDRKAASLSVNDLQKVALGRSMIVQPTIFLLDEPFSNLDAAFRAYMRAELKRLQRRDRPDHDLRHPRPGRGNEHGRSDRGDEPRRDPAVRAAAGDLHASGEHVRRRLRRIDSDQLPAGRGDAAVALRRAANGDGARSESAPSYLQLVPRDATEATMRATVRLVEPLGAKDVVHLEWNDHQMRALGRPGQRPRLGDEVGVGSIPQQVRSSTTRGGRRPDGPHPARRSDQVLRRRDGAADVSLDIADGEFFAILGPPGAGKTTLLRTIVGLETPEHGDVFADEQRITDVFPGDRNLAIMFQNLALYPDKSVFGNLAFPLRQAKVPRKEIRRRVRRRRRSYTSSRCWGASRPSCPAASASVSRSAACSCATSAPCFSTSRSRPSTRMLQARDAG